MKLNIVPTPKGVVSEEKMLFFAPALSHGDFDAEAEVFADMMKKCHGIDLAFAENGIGTVRCDIFAPGEYRLYVHERIVIYAFDGEGAMNGFTSLLQAAEIRDGKLMIPEMTVSDAPGTAYRGLMIDSARSFHTLDELKKYVDLCRFWKMKYLHIHFSDDQSYTLPSKKYPKLSTEGCFYTFAEIAELDEYAASRCIEIVPEVDTPGHSTIMQNAYPEIFGNRGILAFTRRSIDAVGEIYREICDMFPHSGCIHLGGDESRLGWWVEWDECTEFGKECGFTKDDEAPGMTGSEYLMLRYLAYFIKCSAETVISCGKRPIVWEGFHKCTNDMIPKETAVMVFDSSYQLPDSLIAGGFEIINCSWLPTYVVTPTWHYTAEQCFDWDIGSYGTINDGSPYRNGIMKFDMSPSVIGGQLSSWGDTIESAFPSKEAGHEDEMNKIRERLPFISENLWNREKISTYADVSKGVSKTEELLDRLLG